MRVVVRVLGVVVGALGVVLLGFGVVAGVWVGPDDTVDLRTASLSTDGVAIATQPGLLSRFGPTLHVRATTRTADRVWVGVAHQGDLDSYVGGRARTDLARVSRTGVLVGAPVQGRPSALTPPGGLEWWVTADVGTTATLSWPISDGHYGVAVVRADGKPGLAVDLRVGVTLPGLFRTTVLVAGTGLVLQAIGGLVIWLTLRRPAPAVAGVPW